MLLSGLSSSEGDDQQMRPYHALFLGYDLFIGCNLFLDYDLDR